MIGLLNRQTEIRTLFIYIEDYVLYEAVKKKIKKSIKNSNLLFLKKAMSPKMNKI